jgi:hypothetical protein
MNESLIQLKIAICLVLPNVLSQSILHYLDNDFNENLKMMTTFKQWPVELLKITCQYEKSSYTCVQVRSGKHDDTILSTYCLRFNEWQLCETRYSNTSLEHDVICLDDTIIYLHNSMEIEKYMEIEICQTLFDTLPKSRKISIKNDDICYLSSHCMSNDNSLYIIGGTQQRSASDIVTLLELNGCGDLIKLPNMSCSRQTPACIILNRMLYVIGGDLYKINTERMCLATRKWTSIAHCKIGRSGRSKCFSVAGGILLIGGECGHVATLPEFYNIENDTWQILKWSMPFTYPFYLPTIVGDNLVLVDVATTKVWIRPLQNLFDDVPFQALPSLPNLSDGIPLWSFTFLE